jgi:hypothetical protein
MKQYFEQLIARNQLEQVIELMFEAINLYNLSKHDKEILQDINKNLIMTSGRLQNALAEYKQGLIRLDEVNFQKAHIRNALLDIISQMPEDFYEIVQEMKHKHIEPEIEDLSLRQQVLLSKNKNFEFDIFLSFSSRDIDYVRTIRDELTGYGMRVFFSDDTLRNKKGVSFFELIDHALQNSKNFVLICTPNSMQSEYVKAEYETFYQECTVKDKKKQSFYYLCRHGFRFKTRTADVQKVSSSFFGFRSYRLAFRQRSNNCQKY